MSVRLLSSWSPGWGLLLAGGLAGLAWWLVRRETSRLPTLAAWTLPILRAAAVFLITLTITEPAFESRTRQGNPGRLSVILDASRSMSLTDAGSAPAIDSNRFERASRLLLQSEQGLLSQLRDRFDVRLFLTTASDTPVMKWDSLASDELPSSLAETTDADWVPHSALADTLLGLADSSDCLLLLSDGQNNSGNLWAEATEQLKGQGVAVFAVGMGDPQGGDDLALLSGRIPQRVFRDDKLSGDLIVSESNELDTTYQVQIRYRDEVLWQREFEPLGVQQRTIDFSIAVADILKRARSELPADAQLSTLPVHLEARLISEHDRHPHNNSTSLTTSVMVRPTKVLLLDGRSRWETRYLKNLFSRDPAWELTSEIVHAGGQQLSRFPASREDLFDFNLVILGELPGGTLDSRQLTWLIEFVELAGGGLMVIDGLRCTLQQADFQPLQQILPVRWNGERSTALAKRVRLTPEGRELNALQIGDDSTEPHIGNQIVWNALPSLQFVSPVEALPGSQVLLTADNDRRSSPLLVSRPYGAGRVLYWATDETWKWRYKVADKIHSQLWNQLARWSMRTPFSMQGDYLSLDSGDPSYRLGQTIEIRCELRNADGSPASVPSVSAILQDDQQTVNRITLLEDSHRPGTYRGTTNSLPAGNYRVRIEASGFPEHALDLESEFNVIGTAPNELLVSGCNVEDLQQICRSTQGAFVTEADSTAIVEQILPRSGGSIERSTTMIWQSYWWFLTAMSLLITEWWLRKRAGLW